MFAINRQNIKEFPQDVQLLHADLWKKYKAYDIFCFCPGRLYNLRISHEHDRQERFDWFLIVSETSGKINLYPDPGNDEGSHVVLWHDPKMFDKIYKHIDSIIKRFGIPKRSKRKKTNE